MNLYSYVVRYDSGFAPNPFYGYCTLATCKIEIRKSASIGDWIVGCGSANKKVRQEGRLVYAMQVNECITFEEYFEDQRFQCKKPNLRGSRKQARGDNIYSKKENLWNQLNSFHSKKDGSPNKKHINRDTKFNKVLISNRYVYFGKNGHKIPENLISGDKTLCHKGQAYRKFSTNSELEDKNMIENFEKWFSSLNQTGQVGLPVDWGEKHKN